MDDLFENPDDKIEVEPPELGPALVAVMTSTLSKELAKVHEKPWTDKLESDMQEKISALVAGANERGLKTVRVVVIRKNGQKVSRDLDIDRINKTRSLQ